MQDSALDSLVAARHAVLADLARDPPPGAGAAAAADFLRRDSAGERSPRTAGAPRREAALLDPLLQARRLVRCPKDNLTLNKFEFCCVRALAPAARPHCWTHCCSPCRLVRHPDIIVNPAASVHHR